jgi:hypothetical protein
MVFFSSQALQKGGGWFGWTQSKAVARELLEAKEHGFAPQQSGLLFGALCLPFSNE